MKHGWKTERKGGLKKSVIYPCFIRGSTILAS